MSIALVRARALEGLAAPEVTVEVHLANGLPAFSLVGLPDTEVREARDRVRAAIQSSQFEFPQREILAHLGEPVDPPCIAPAHGPPLWETAGSGDDELLIQPLPEYEFDQRIAW